MLNRYEHDDAGALAESVGESVPNIRRLLDAARQQDSTVVYVNDNHGDWTEWIQGTNSIFSGRPRGWDLVDHDVAVIDAATWTVGYLNGLMRSLSAFGMICGLPYASTASLPS